MKPLLCAAAIAAATSVLGAPAHAQNYPWCAKYSGGPARRRVELRLRQLPAVHGHRHWNRRLLRAQHVVPIGGAARPAALLSVLSTRTVRSQSWSMNRSAARLRCYWRGLQATPPTELCARWAIRCR